MCISLYYVRPGEALNCNGEIAWSSDLVFPGKGWQWRHHRSCPCLHGIQGGRRGNIRTKKSLWCDGNNRTCIRLYWFRCMLCLGLSGSPQNGLKWIFFKNNAWRRFFTMKRRQNKVKNSFWPEFSFKVRVRGYGMNLSQCNACVCVCVRTRDEMYITLRPYMFSAVYFPWSCTRTSV